jgi:hypothetical protein
MRSDFGQPNLLKNLPDRKVVTWRPLHDCGPLAKAGEVEVGPMRPEKPARKMAKAGVPKRTVPVRDEEEGEGPPGDEEEPVGKPVAIADEERDPTEIAGIRRGTRDRETFQKSQGQPTEAGDCLFAGCVRAFQTSFAAKDDIPPVIIGEDRRR